MSQPTSPQSHQLMDFTQIFFYVIKSNKVTCSALHSIPKFKVNESMGECNTILSAYTLYRHLGQYCTHPSEWLNPFPNKPLILRVCSTNLLKALWEKEKLLVTSNFSLSHSFFYHIGELSSIFIKFKTVVCRIFSL